jgi:hypothetical protein
MQPEQRTLVGDESVMTIAQMRSTIDLKMVAVTWNALYDTTPQQKPVTTLNFPVIIDG